MTLPPIKLTWGTKKAQPTARWRFGLFGYYNIHGHHVDGLAISLRGALLWGLFTLCLAWGAGTSFIYYRWQRATYNYVTWTDCLLYPLRKDEITEKRGKAAIAQGFDDLKNRKDTAIGNLRVGLHRYPKDTRARITLAQVFLAWGIRPQAVKLLNEGMEYGYPGRAYLELALELAAQGEDYDLWIDLCQQAMSLADKDPSVSASDRQWLAEQLVKALFSSDRHAEALAYSNSAPELPNTLRRELKILTFLNDGDKVTATNAAANWVAADPSSQQALRLLARCYREQNNIPKLTTTLAQLRERNRADPQVYAFSIVQLMMVHQNQAASDILDDYIFRFGSVSANYIILSTALGQIGNVELIDKLRDRAREHGFRLTQIDMARLQALIQQKRWTDARRQADTLRQSLAEEARAPQQQQQQQGTQSTLELLSRLINAASDATDASQTALIEQVRERQLPLATYRRLIDTLMQNGRDATARHIVTYAIGAYPQNPYLQEKRIVLDEKAKAAADAAALAAAGVNAGTAFPANAAAFYKELDELSATHQPFAGLRLIREIRRINPSWFSAEENEASFRELKFVSEDTDILRLQLQARTYINGDLTRNEKATTLAKTLYDSGQKDAGLIIIKEVLRRTTDYAPAQKLLDLWEPKPKPKPPAAAPAPVESPKS
ncbi:hypothetical protein Ga0100231_002225 [Opitutaceae bacterium TAV4]|nr:hypothetical protein Ga0100231_002225 [Opitutaceae bacterium TAV4]RRK01776.1 hypothetical protein Ga0100230_000415 [Opitutaceae bacterium TAV3]